MTIRQKYIPLLRFDNRPKEAPIAAIGMMIQFSAPKGGRNAGIASRNAMVPIRKASMLAMIAHYIDQIILQASGQFDAIARQVKN